MTEIALESSHRALDLAAHTKLTANRPAIADMDDTPPWEETARH